MPCVGVTLTTTRFSPWARRELSCTIVSAMGSGAGQRGSGCLFECVCVCMYAFACERVLTDGFNAFYLAKWCSSAFACIPGDVVSRSCPCLELGVRSVPDSCGSARTYRYQERTRQQRSRTPADHLEKIVGPVELLQHSPGEVELFHDRRGSRIGRCDRRASLRHTATNTNTINTTTTTTATTTTSSQVKRRRGEESSYSAIF